MLSATVYGLSGPNASAVTVTVATKDAQNAQMQNTRQCTTGHAHTRGWEPGWRAAIAILRLWHRRLRTRHNLRELESHHLGDIGLTERDRRREGAKWFWQV